MGGTMERGNSASFHATKPSRSVAVCSGLMSLLFFYSASVQLDDPDWYFWLPLYSAAFLVCLVHTVRFSAATRMLAYAGLVGGALLFVKVVSRACIKEATFSWNDLLSLDMGQSLVREKFGSLLVCLALWLELQASASDPHVAEGHPENQQKLHADIGLPLVVALSAYLCYIFFFQTAAFPGHAAGESYGWQ